MEQKTDKTASAKGRRRVGLARGDGMVASLGLAVAAVVVGVLAASAWWTLRTHRASLTRAREEEITVVARLLAQTSERMLSEGELGEVLSGVRSMVSESAATYGLKDCRVVLADGTVLADRDASKISRTIAERWPAVDGSGLGRVERGEGGAVTVRQGVRVPGRGEAVLEVTGEGAASVWADWEVQAGIGVIGAGGMAGLLLVYRAMRSRWRGLGAVAEALRLEASGRATAGSAEVSDALGPEARALAALVRERDGLKEEVAVLKAVETLGASRGGETELAGACDALWQGLVVLGADGTVKYANGAAGVLLRVKREQALGRPVAELLDDPKAGEAVSAAVRGAQRQRVSLDIERTGEKGERTVLRATVRPMRRDDSAAAVLVLEDVTQQRVADESRNAFVAQATHELRTPLTNIRLYVETLVEQGEDPAARAKCLNVINAESRRLERIVGDMLSVSEIEAGALALRGGEVRLDALFEELEGDYRAQAQDKEIALGIELPPKLPVMQADRDKLMLALHNLVGNALKYTPAGGRVTVRVAAEGGVLKVDVADSGIGIRPEEQELVFEKFYRAKDKRVAGITGSGIGLALARQIARLHGGEITLKSQIDQGSTFTLTVPLAGAGGVKLAA